MKNRFSRTFEILLGRDTETPEACVFRHEREQSLFSLFLIFISSLCVVLVLVIALNGSISMAIQIAIYSFIVMIPTLFLVNSGLKWSQEKYGGD